MLPFILSMLPDEFLPLIIVGGGLAIILGLVAPRAFLGFLGLLLLFTISAPFIEDIIEGLPMWILLILFAIFVLFILRVVFVFLLGQHGGETFVAHLFYDFLRLPFIVLRGIFRLIISLLSVSTRALSRRRLSIFIIALIAPLLLLPYQCAEAKSPAQVAGRAAARGIAKRLNPSHLKKYGSLHVFKRDTKLMRFSDKPLVDKKMGLRSHSYWIRLKSGRIGGAKHVQKKLGINHPVTRGEKIIAKKGRPYHEGPIKKGQAHVREVIIEKPVSGKNIILTKPLPR